MKIWYRKYRYFSITTAVIGRHALLPEPQQWEQYFTFYARMNLNIIKEAKAYRIKVLLSFIAFCKKKKKKDNLSH